MATSTAKPPVMPTEDQLLAEHRRIRALLRLVEGSRDLTQLLRLLDELRGILPRHFRVEEAPDGFYDTLRRTSPRQLASLDELQREHPALLEQIDGLTDQARACLAGPVAAILAEACVLVRRVKEHEKREDELLLDTIYIDLGHGD